MHTRSYCILCINEGVKRKHVFDWCTDNIPASSSEGLSIKMATCRHGPKARYICISNC